MIMIMMRYPPRIAYYYASKEQPAKANLKIKIELKNFKNDPSSEAPGDRSKRKERGRAQRQQVRVGAASIQQNERGQFFKYFFIFLIIIKFFVLPGSFSSSLINKMLKLK